MNNFFYINKFETKKRKDVEVMTHEPTSTTNISEPLQRENKSGDSSSLKINQI